MYCEKYVADEKRRSAVSFWKTRFLAVPVATNTAPVRVCTYIYVYTVYASRGCRSEPATTSDLARLNAATRATAAATAKRG